MVEFFVIEQTFEEELVTGEHFVQFLFARVYQISVYKLDVEIEGRLELFTVHIIHVYFIYDIILKLPIF